MHFALLSMHLCTRSIFAVGGTTLLMQEVHNLVEQSDILHCRTSAQPAILYPCSKSLLSEGEIHSLLDVY